MSILSRILASRPVFAAIRWWAFRHPHNHLLDLDGSLYMGRWHVIDEGTWASKLLKKATGYSSVRLHRIMKADHDRDMHSHPFEYRTYILGGDYTERFAERICDDVPRSPGPHLVWLTYPDLRMVEAGETAVGPPGRFHRIIDVSDGGVWTLFCMTDNAIEWGFAIETPATEEHDVYEWLTSRQYFRRRGYGAQHRGAVDNADLQRLAKGPYA